MKVRRRQLHGQQRSATCAVASVRTVLDLQFHYKIPERSLVVLGTEAHFPIIKMGTDYHHLRRMVKEACRAFNKGKPWTLRLRRSGAVADLQEALASKRFPLVSVYNEGDLHMIVVLQVTEEQIRYWDPAPGNPVPIWIDHDAFMGWWTDARDGRTEYAVIGGGSLVNT